MGSPVRVQHIAKTLIRSTAKQEVVVLIAHNEGKHERVAYRAADSFHRAMLAAMHSMRKPTGMQTHEAGRSCT